MNCLLIRNVAGVLDQPFEAVKVVWRGEFVERAIASYREMAWK